ncbi:MAG: M48 family metalloprotease [Candidatus Omnitrophica bacterium]|nr:M48 family metalloprotease [Candidatus Omnitrophota bacterium]
MKDLSNFITALSIFLILPVFSGCGTVGVYNPATQQREFIFISTAEELNMGTNIHEDILKTYSLSTDEAKVERLRKIGQRVALVSDRQDYPYKFYLIDKDELNAFTIPGGRVYMYSGLFDRLGSDAKIAAVLAHEIGHCAAKHTVKKFQASMGYNLLATLLLNQVDSGSARQLAELSSGMVMKIVFSAYGRQDEYESDRLAVKYMYLAGYPPISVEQALETLKTEKESGFYPTILRTHPHLDDRIKAVKSEIENVSNEYQ